MDKYPGELPVPPNAPRPRGVVQEPLEVLDRLVADQASQLLDDENAEQFAQLADEIAITRGSWLFADRLRAAVGSEVRIDVDVAVGAQSWSTWGQLVEVGQQWCHLRESARQVVINSAVIASVVSAGGSLPEMVVSGSLAPTWASLLRRFELAGTVVTVHGRSHPTRVGRIVLVGQDHFDLSLVRPDSRLTQLDTVSIATGSVVVIEWR